MSEKVRVLGVDPSLRNTGLAVLEYNTEKQTLTKPQHCQVLVNPEKFTGKDAIMNMIDMIKTVSNQPAYRDVDFILIESPAAAFNDAWAAGTISLIAHISGAAVALLGIEKAFLLRPSEWNRGKKKNITHNQTIAVLGNPDTWGYEAKVKSEKYMEHILDASSMALWWIRKNYIEE